MDLRVGGLGVSGLGVGGLRRVGGLGVGVLVDQLGQSGQHGGDLSGDRGRSGQVVALGQESVLIGSPCQGDLLSFGADVVGRSLVGVARVVADHLLGVGFIAGRSVRSGVAANIIQLMMQVITLKKG